MLSLENDRVRRNALQFCRLQSLVAHRSADQLRGFQGSERLTHAVVSAAERVERVAQHVRQFTTGKRVPISVGAVFGGEATTLQGQVAVVGRIVGDLRRPTLVHHRLFALEPFALGFFLGRVDVVLAHTGFVNEQRIGRPDNQPSSLADFQAQIHIVKGNGQADLVHPPHLLVQLGADHQAGGGDRAVILIKMQAVKVAVGLH
ncbi:hypothetical protein D3C81_1343580 [compost metagenome]